MTQFADNTDPGLNPSLSGYGIATPDAPFYGLFPPAGGTEYSDTIASAVQHNVSYGDTVLSVAFNGTANLILGNSYTTSTVSDPSMPGDDIYTFTYANSDLQLAANIALGDPPIDFYGPLTLTAVGAAPTAAVPDSSTGWVGVFALLSVCMGGAWVKAREA